MPFLFGEIPKVTGNSTTFRRGGTQEITRVEATTEQGIFRGARAIIGDSNFQFLAPEKASIVLSANDLEFIAGEQSSEEIWCAPLFGNLEQFRGTETACSINDRGSHVSFEVDGNAYGLEILRPAEGLNYGNYGAVVFGEIGTRPHNTVEEVRRLLPTGLMSALSFAAGSGIRDVCMSARE
jgi:hypothetical protein